MLTIYQNEKDSTINRIDTSGAYKSLRLFKTCPHLLLSPTNNLTFVELTAPASSSYICEHSTRMLARIFPEIISSELLANRKIQTFYAFLKIIIHLEHLGVHLENIVAFLHDAQLSLVKPMNLTQVTSHTPLETSISTKNFTASY